jgi:hypothetical protein
VQDGESSSRSLLKRLLGVLEDSRQPPITRSAAAAYIASFLARAAFLSDQVVVEYTVQLATWCMRYCTSQDAEVTHPRSVDQQRSAVTTSPGVVHQVRLRTMQLVQVCQQLRHVGAWSTRVAGMLSSGGRHWKVWDQCIS